MRIERDVAVPTRDGSPILADVFRPEGDEPVPVLAGISPYGKDVHWPDRFPLYELVEPGEHTVWETPDPDWWVPRGYAVLRADTRGTGKSPGTLDLLGPKDAEDFHDVIEWAGTQPWSSGRVAATGISWFAMMAWRVAALQPPHLAAVIAWEGLTDFYREFARQGGMYAEGFTELWWRAQVEPQRNGTDGGDWRVQLPEHPLLDAFHEERTTDLSRVTAPLLSAGNWGALHLHLRGNIEGWLGAASEHKWLVVHTGTHIDPFYSDWGRDLQLRFLDRFLKGEEDRMDGVAPVRLAIRSGRDVTWRDADAWPLPGTDWRELHLGQGTLAFAPPEQGTVEHPASFETAPATERLELTGPVALRLWVTPQAEDLEVFVRLQHVGADGEVIPGVGPQGAPIPMALGWLRASHRELDPGRSEPYRPVHPHRRAVPLVPGEPILLEIEVWPTSITLAEGERLRLELPASDDDLAPITHRREASGGATIHVGGQRASHLLVPVIPSPEDQP